MRAGWGSRALGSPRAHAGASLPVPICAIGSVFGDAPQRPGWQAPSRRKTDQHRMVSFPEETPATSLPPSLPITRQAVLDVMGEYDELGPDGFYDQYRYRDARDYVVVHDGKEYPSKGLYG